MSNLVFMAVLSGVSWEVIVRTLELRERGQDVGDGNIEGYKYTLIQRGERISIVLPDYHPQEKCPEAVKKIYSKLSPKSAIQIVTMGHASSHCNYCLTPIPLPYRCYRCNGWYCNSHRLPEQHNCPGGKGRPTAITEQIKSKNRELREGKRKLVVVAVPCG